MAGPGITLIKSFTYRGASEEWSNQYHLGQAGADPADWRGIVDDLVALEKTVYTDSVHILRALCYDDTDNPTTYSYDLADFAGVVDGTLSPGTSFPMPGDTAGWVRWNTGKVSSTGKPVYLRKYFHDVLGAATPTSDNIYAAQVAAYQDFGDNLLVAALGTTGFAQSDGSPIPGPAKASTYATTRTLHRRGRRP